MRKRRHKRPAAPSGVATQRVEGARAALDQIREMLANPRISDATLQDLRGKIAPTSRKIQAVINDLTPRLAEIKTRLAQLGPKPDSKAPPENASVTAERDSQQKLYDSIDGVLKQARLLGVEIDQTNTTIVDRRRALFTRALFTRSKSLLSPALWSDVIAEAPRDAQAMAAIGGAWLSELASRLYGWRLASFLATLAAIIGFFVLAARVERGVLERETTDGADSTKEGFAALWIASVTAIVPIVMMIALMGVLRALTFVDPSLDPLIRAIFDGFTRVALTVGVARAFFAPSHSNWRLIEISDATAESLSRLSVIVVAIVSITKILDAMNDLDRSLVTGVRCHARREFARRRTRQRRDAAAVGRGAR